MRKDKICPFTFTLQNENEFACIGAYCELWDDRHERCAFVSIAFSLANIYKELKELKETSAMS